MKLFYPKDSDPQETRAAIIPEVVQKLTALGLKVQIETGIGHHINIEDGQYVSVGAQVVNDRYAALEKADVVLRLNKPPLEDVHALKKGAVHVSFLDPFRATDLIATCAEMHVSAVSMELIPRSTNAQKMDALSSQASIAGYFSIILAAERLNRIFPMMMTPAGTLNPARVFIIGAGVAGLQAIATAKRLGARVEAYDTRPVAAEQIHSLGAKSVKIDLGETGQTQQGYAKPLTAEQIEKQRAAQEKILAHSDVVVTTAQIFGKEAPLLITRSMVECMPPGSVIVDMAVESGGNVELSECGQEVHYRGVKILGYPQLARYVPVHASQAYAMNLYHLLCHLKGSKSGHLKCDRNDEILSHCLITHDGDIVHEKFKLRPSVCTT